MTDPWWMRDSWEMVRRNLIHIKRTPELLLDVTLSPIMFVLLFSLVFGGAINSSAGVDYTNFLLAGIFVQTIAFAGIYTSVLLANDLQKGMIDRFRSLPMSQSSVLIGRTVTDLLRAMIAIAIMWVVGFAGRLPPRGWHRRQPGRDRHHAALRLRPLVAGRGRRGACPNAGSAAGHHLRRRLSADLCEQRVRFDSTCPTGSSGSRTQPMTLVMDSVRDLSLKGEAGPALVPALLWSVGALVIFFPIGMWAYNRRTTQ